MRRKRRPSKPKNKDVYATLAAEKKGHTYQDYLKYVEENDIITVQMDCVEGRKTDSEAILSLHWPEFHMQLYFIMPLHDAANVVAQLDIIEEALGFELFQECLPLILTDNGEEFTNIEGMERSCTKPGQKRTMIFFCEPNRFDQKGACERNHRLLRRIIPSAQAGMIAVTSPYTVSCRAILLLRLITSTAIPRLNLTGQDPLIWQGLSFQKISLTCWVLRLFL